MEDLAAGTVLYGIQKFLRIVNFRQLNFHMRVPIWKRAFPGNVNVEVVYTWTDKNEIVMDYTCTTDKKTVVNVTNHAYFNLHGAGNGDILDHVLTLKASAFHSC